MLWSIRSLPERRRRICCNTDRKCLYRSLVPCHVVRYLSPSLLLRNLPHNNSCITNLYEQQAMARPNHRPCHRVRLLHRLRQQLRPDRRCHWAPDFQKQIRATLHRAVRRSHGPGGPLRNPDTGDLVGDSRNGA